MIKLVSRKPNGEYIIAHVLGMFLTDSTGAWGSNLDQALCFESESDAQFIVDGLVQARAVMGGIKTFGATADGEIISHLHVLPYR